MATTKELLAQRMQEARDEVEAIKARTGPQRATRAALLQQIAELQPKVAELTAEIRKEDESLAALKQEISNIAQALGSKKLSGG